MTIFCKYIFSAIGAFTFMYIVGVFIYVMFIDLDKWHNKNKARCPSLQEEVKTMTGEVDYEGNILVNEQTMPAINVNIGKHLERHVQVITKRKEVVSDQILKLAQELCSLAMYVERPTVIVENCKFAVEFTKSDAYYLRIYLKDVGRGDADKLTWKDIISKVSSEPSVLKTRQSLTQLVDGIRGRGRNKSSQPTLASITLNSHWMITNDALPLSMIRLLPAARMLVKEQLALMYDAAQDDIEYIQQWPSDDDELSSEVEEAMV